MKTIFIVLDTVRRDYLTAYGNTWVKTPSLTRLAQQGITFDNHWAGSLPCMPARREFMTGRYNFIYRGWGPIEPYDDVLPRELRKKGVFSHILTDHYHYFRLGGENYHTGFDTWEFFRGQEDDPWVSFVDAPALPEYMRKLTQQNWNNRTRQQKEEEFSGPQTAQAAIKWLEANKRADNWFLQVEIFDPHEPYYCTPKYRQMYGDTWDGPLLDWLPYGGEASESPQAIEHVRKCYAALLTMTDYWVGKIFEKMDELHLWEDTLVVFTTDHGTLLAEHKYWNKAFMPLYNEIARIPLVIYFPGSERAGSRISALTQTIDLMPTFLDFYGCSPPPYLHGHSLKPVIFEGKNVRQDCIYGYFGTAMNITDGHYAYLRNPVNKDAGPLYEYTAMPTRFNRWQPREVYDQVEMGRYFGHTYNLPLYKFPTKGQVPAHLAGEESYVGRHQLFDIQKDPGQLLPIQNQKLETHFTQRIAAHLKVCEAQPEQYIRLGIAPS